MTRFFKKKSIGLFLLSIAICGFFYSGIGVANAQTPVISGHLIYTDYTGEGEAAEQHYFEYLGNQSWSEIDKNGKVIGAAISDADMLKNHNQQNNFNKAQAQETNYKTNLPATYNKPVAENPSVSGSDVADFIGGILNLPTAAAWLSFFNILFYTLAFILSIAGFLLDGAIGISLFGMSKIFANLGPLDQVWSLVRDTMNIVFIFMLLYIAISMILGSLGVKAKASLTSVIVSALFINFSMFIAKVIIDAGNLVAVALYNQIPGNSAFVGTGSNLGHSILSGLIVNGLSGQNWGQFFLSLSTFSGQANILVFVILKTIVVGISCYVLIYAGGIFIGRIVMLMILAVTSPVGFIGGAIPWLDDLRGKWWKTFTDQVIVAPMFMFLMLLFVKMLDIIHSISQDTTNASMWATISTKFDWANYLFYILMIILLWEGMKMVKQTSGKVGEMANKIGAALTVAGAAVATMGVAGVVGVAGGVGAAARGGSFLAGAAKGAGRVMNVPYKFATGEYENKSGPLGYAGRVVRGGILGGAEKMTGGFISEKTVKEEMARKRGEVTKTETELKAKQERMASTYQIAMDRAQATAEKITKEKKDTLENENKTDRRNLDRAKKWSEELDQKIAILTNAGQPVPADLTNQKAQADERLSRAHAELDDSTQRLRNFQITLKNRLAIEAANLGTTVSELAQEKVSAIRLTPEIKAAALKRIRLATEIKQGQYTTAAILASLGRLAITPEAQEKLGEEMYKGPDKKS